MRILMISVNDLASEGSLGVTKKILGQFKAFNNLGHETWNLCMKNGNVVLIGPEGTQTVVMKRLKSYFTVCALFLNTPQVCKELQVDLCYIRYPLADWAFIKMVKELHKICRVVVEIPTYPYDRQNRNNKNLVAQFNMLQDNKNRTSLKQYVNIIATFSNEEQIYGIPCVNISNAVDLSQIEYIGDELEYNRTINLIGVARLQRDHGYDRIIEGLHNYYEDKVKKPYEIRFHIVGNGDAYNELMMLTKKYKLEQYVSFYGTKKGQQLNELYRKSQIAVGILGLYRSGIDTISSLKNYEYCALGIPFIDAANDPSIPNDANWQKKVPNCEDAIDMNTVISFFEYIKAHPEIHCLMRKKAEDVYTWENQMKKVIDSAFSINE